MLGAEIISTADAVSRLTVVGLLALYSVLVTILAWKLWRESVVDRKESSGTYIGMLKERFTDDGRRVDLFRDLGETMDNQVNATRELARSSDIVVRELQTLRQELGSLRSDVQRLRL